MTDDTDSTFDDSEFDSHRKQAIETLALDDARSFWVQVVREDGETLSSFGFRNPEAGSEDVNVLVAHHLAQMAGDAEIEEYADYVVQLAEMIREESVADSRGVLREPSR